MRRAHALWIVALLLLAPPSPAAEAPCLRRTVVVNVFNERGEPVTGLDAGAFEARLRGKPVKIVSAEFDFSPRRIVVLLDVSEDMKDMGDWQFAVDLTRSLVRRQPLENIVALALFADTIKEKFGFTDNRETLLQVLDQLHNGGKPPYLFHQHSHLWATLQEVLNSAGQLQPGDAVFAILPVVHGASGANWRKISDAMVATGVRLFIIGISPRRGIPFTLFSSPALYGEYENRRAAVTNTGGAQGVAGMVVNTESLGGSVVPLEPDKSELTLDFMQSRTNAVYKLQLELSQGIQKPQQWELKLSPSPVAKKDKWQILYPHELLPCSGSTPQK